jgi:hypothetical protein
MLTLCAAAILAAPALSRAQDTTNAPAAMPLPPVTVPETPPAAAQPPPSAAAAQTPAAAPLAPPAKKHVTVPQFRGTLTAVDTNAMTLTVGKRTFDMTSETIVTKDGKPAVLADGVVGDPVRGAYKKNAKGELDAIAVHFGGNAEGAKKESTNN